MRPPAINSFTGPYRFLSNFYPARVEWEGLAYQTVEHAYQASKTNDLAARRSIMIAPSPGEAKRLGRVVPLRKGWKDDRLSVMETLLRQKFTGELATKLAETYPAPLIEGNFWKDRFWGVYQGEGLNHLGKLLMKIREELI